jgi:hypothetical protein
MPTILRGLSMVVLNKNTSVPDIYTMHSQSVNPCKIKDTRVLIAAINRVRLLEP